MIHGKINWNPATKQWFCTRCGQTSDHVSEQDAHLELDQYECQIPSVEASETFPGEETVQLIKKPFKMVPRNKKE
jgi:hypothetical protein